MKTFFKTSSVLALLSPMMVFAIAQTIPATGLMTTTSIDTWITAIGDWVQTLAIILVGVALLVFFWGIIRYVMAGGDEEKRAAGRSLMIYGVIGLFVMVAIWGLVYFLASVLGIGVGGGVDIPAIPDGTITGGGTSGGTTENW